MNDHIDNTPHDTDPAPPVRAHLTLACPFWCVVHHDGITPVERPHEGRPIAAAGIGGEVVTLSLLQENRQPCLEVDLDGRGALLPLDAAQPLIAGLRELYGMAQRAGSRA